MSIKRMLLLASMALAAIAFAAPAAQAEVVLTDSKGNLLQEGAAVTATSTNLKTTVGGPTLECEEVTLHYTLQTNGPEEVVLQPTSAHNATTKGCVTNVPFFGKFTNHITNAGAEELVFNTAGTAEVGATFTSNTTALGRHCTYHGTIPLQGTNTTDVIHVERPNSLTGTGEGCGEGEMHGSFTVTSGGKAVTGHFSG